MVPPSLSLHSLCTDTSDQPNGLTDLPLSFSVLHLVSGTPLQFMLCAVATY